MNEVLIYTELYNEICSMAEMQYGIKDLKLSEITPLGNDKYRLEPENRKGFEPSYVDVKVYETTQSWLEREVGGYKVKSDNNGRPTMYWEWGKA